MFRLLYLAAGLCLCALAATIAHLSPIVPPVPLHPLAWLPAIVGISLVVAAVCDWCRRSMLFASIVAAFVMFVALQAPAFAQEGNGAGILTSPAVGFAFELAIVVFGPILAGLGGLVLARLYKLAGLKQTAENRATVEQVLERAVDFARARYGAGAFGAIPTSMRESAIRSVAEYAIERGPDALRSFGITRKDSQALRKMITARISGAFDDGTGSAPQAIATAS